MWSKTDAGMLPPFLAVALVALPPELPERGFFGPDEEDEAPLDPKDGDAAAAAAVFLPSLEQAVAMTFLK